MDTITQLGVGGIFAVLLTKIVLEAYERLIVKKGAATFGFDAGRIENCVENDDKYHQLTTEVHELWLWHNKEDSDGVKVWYVKQSLESAMIKLSEVIDKQNRVLDKMLDKLEDVHDNVESLKK